MASENPTSPTSPSPDAVTALVGALLDLRTWQAFDIDADGRVLAGHDELGSVQLVEIDPDGRRTPLTDLPSRCTGRYVPGRRQVVVQHDQGGDENMQLSLLDLSSRPAAPATLEQLTPLVHDPAFMHVLRDVTPDHLVYSTNRRNAVDMDVVVRAWDTGAEETVWDGGGYVTDTVVSHDGGSVAVTALSLRPASTLVFLAGPRAVGGGRVTDPDEHAAHHCGGWTPDDDGLVLPRTTTASSPPWSGSPSTARPGAPWSPTTSTTCRSGPPPTARPWWSAGWSTVPPSSPCTRPTARCAAR